MEIKSKTKPSIPGGEDLNILVILPYFNETIGLELYQNTEETLLQNGVKKKNIKLLRIPGAFELPYAAQNEIKRSSPDAVIALGVVIKGETDHYDQVCDQTFRGLMDVQLKLETPIIFGILTCNTKKQAENRASSKGLNKGKSYALAALIQANL
ncbi:6,7-dimethyl-8-ribityllumazine synthase [Candidatus Peregrinibacteria bacterium]|nr:6,7-dimethyl-8-ribityllumazine synthase [Candidatus Peregrinibacteria bacterium]MBT4148338.1 6,7-dimethyl-8-ribityllumazine synthase [Candidatus Peregrinibacteria bacterium]MBT4366381.1 6,7-dimethyl-8-ribityllumazine synthase [Candidatus Peregrinibacteria bacterium]MBT4455909.1 6,7-dimethyl-8-ribityllumazine synthase [Candidatus Peregrinibacteria bacterium]